MSGKPNLSIAPRTSPRPCGKEPCKSCPFRKTSMRGWLGEYDSPGEFLEVHYRGETLNPCHETLDYGDPDWRKKFFSGEKGRSCRGQAVFFSNSLKLPRPTVAPEEVSVQRVETDRESCFSWPHEFLKHHGGE